MIRRYIPWLMKPIGMVVLLLFIASLGGLVRATPSPADLPVGTPSIVSYQGHIYDGDVPYDGTGYFMFAIYDSESNLAWSNDGANPPTTSVSLEVSQGLFSVNLGDTALAGMLEPLTVKSFDVPDTFLTVWFSPDDSTWTMMPELQIAAVPYALKAEFAIEAQTANKLGSYYPSQYQLRIADSCLDGQAIKQVNSDGTVVCESIPLVSTFSINVIDNDVNQENTSIAIGSDGMGLIGYVASNCLTVAHCNDTACTTATTSQIDCLAGRYASIAIGADGLGLISYHDFENNRLKVAHCNDVPCSTAATYTLDSAVNVGEYTAIAIGDDHLGLISYYDYGNDHLKVAHCDNTNCSTATTYTLDDSTNVGQYSSLAIGYDGLGLISYRDDHDYYLKVAHCDNTDCSSATIYTLDDSAYVGAYTSIAIGIDLMGLISYYDASNQSLKVAHCSNFDCSTATISTLDSSALVGFHTGITIGLDGLGLISYFDYQNDDLKVAHCNNLNCSSATLSNLDMLGDVGYYTSIATGSDGLGLISYISSSQDDLKVAHCSNELCLPINWER